MTKMGQQHQFAAGAATRQIRLAAGDSPYDEVAPIPAIR
jgi:hypothetical protein